jgi:hypothetical protein
MKTRLTYFAFFAKSGEYKIGSSVNPHRRLRVLTGKYPQRGLHKLLGVIPCSELSEDDAHSMFSKYRVTGEWYAFNASALRKMKALLPANWKRIVPRPYGQWMDRESIALMRKHFPAKSTAASMQLMIDAVLVGLVTKPTGRKVALVCTKTE